MQYRKLGRSGLEVSPLCLGTMTFGGPTEEATALRIVAKAREAGVNFIDSADAYNGGKSEEITGRAISNARDEWVLATKLANPMGDGPNRGGLSRKWVMLEAEASLRRLGTDYIDIYYLHKEDHATPLDETVRAMADLIRHGKVRYFGLSNYRAWRVAEICRICDGLGIDRPVVSQPYYHALNRVAETEHLPACAHFGLGIVAYSPLARGISDRKVQPRRAPAARDPRRPAGQAHDADRMAPGVAALAQEIKRYAQARGVTPGQFAFAWVLNNRLVTGAIGGPRTEAQWDDYVGALDYAFTAEDEALIDRLVAAGHPSTPGYNDPAYPIEGRLPRTAAS